MGVSVGDAADLVLLDANPLAHRPNTLKIRAVVLNGRYLSHTDWLTCSESRSLPRSRLIKRLPSLPAIFKFNLQGG